MTAAYNFSPGGSDYDQRKMYNTLTVLDINYWLANMQYFNLNFLVIWSFNIMWAYLSIIDLRVSVFSQSIFYNVIFHVGGTSEIWQIPSQSQHCGFFEILY